MVRILTAFVWLRWRVLMNSLERSGARDTVERFSLAIEQLGPIMTAVLMIPSAILLAGAGGYSGWALAQGVVRPLPFEVLRFLLLVACGLTIVGPLLLPAAERTNAVRLLLLPISRGILYVAQAVTTLTDPWVLLMVPPLAALPVGMAIGGGWGAAIVAAAGVLLIFVFTGLASLSTSAIHMAMRDRRRGELLMLAFMFVLPLIGLLPRLLEQQVAGHGEAAAWLTTIERRAFPLIPSEMYVRSARAAAAGEVSNALRSLTGLVIAAGLLHGAGALVFRRVLDSPGFTSTRRRAFQSKKRTWRIPGISPGTSAIAIAQMRLAFRTPRGRSILLSPLMIFVVFAAMTWRGGSTAELTILPLDSGVALAVFGGFVSLLAILPLSANQFAVDGAGLTLAFLSPLQNDELLHGKAIGNGAIAGIPAMLSLAGAAALFPGGSHWVWLSIPLGLLSVYLLVAPVAAALSAVFPRHVDLNSIGRGSNAHGVAALLGVVACITAGAPALLLAIFIVRSLDRPQFAPPLMLAWCVAAALLCRVLFVPVRALLARRRENLALMR